MDKQIQKIEARHISYKCPFKKLTTPSTQSCLWPFCNYIVYMLSNYVCNENNAWVVNFNTKQYENLEHVGKINCLRKQSIPNINFLCWKNICTLQFPLLAAPVYICEFFSSIILIIDIVMNNVTILARIYATKQLLKLNCKESKPHNKKVNSHRNGK